MDDKEVLRPGEILVYELDARAEDPTAFAIKIGMFPSDLIDLLNGKLPVSERIAQSLERELNMPAAFWLELQAEYDNRLNNK